MQSCTNQHRVWVVGVKAYLYNLEEHVVQNEPAQGVGAEEGDRAAGSKVCDSPGGDQAQQKTLRDGLQQHCHWNESCTQLCPSAHKNLYWDSYTRVRIHFTALPHNQFILGLC